MDSVGNGNVCTKQASLNLCDENEANWKNFITRSEKRRCRAGKSTVFDYLAYTKGVERAHVQNITPSLKMYARAAKTCLLV